MKLDVVGFGALNIDKLYRVGFIAGRGEESFVEGYSESPGGSAANTMVGLARLGYRVGYIGKVGADREGKYIIKCLRDERVDVKGVIKGSSRSGVAIGFIDKSGERTLYIDPGTNDTIDLKEIDTVYLGNVKFLHLTSFVGDKSFETQKKLVKSLSEVKVSFDPGELYARRGLVSLREIVGRSYVMLPNEREVKLITGEDYKKGAKLLINQGVRIVAVKLGGKGCYVTDGDEEFLIEPPKVNVVDTTGSGDAFCAGFLHGLIKGKDIFTCGRLGNLVAGQKIGKIGAREGLPRLDELPEI